MTTHQQRDSTGVILSRCLNLRDVGCNVLKLLQSASRLFLALVIVVLVSACGGNSSTDSNAGSPVVQPQTDNPCVLTATDSCIEAGITTLASGSATKTTAIPQGTGHAYAIPAGSEVVLSSVSGNANLYLYPNQLFTNDNIVCAANSAYVEDICSADSARYAVVYGREDSRYQLSITDDCSVVSQNRWVDRQMKDYYLFYNQVPNLNVDTYESPENLIQALRVNEFDTFSRVGDAAQFEQLYAEGTTFGMGYRLRRDEAGRARIARVYTDSPMGRANVKRSDIIVSINDTPWNEINAGTYNSLVGSADNPLPTRWVFQDSSTGDTRQVELTQSVYSLNTVLHSEVITHPEYSGKIGYLVFERFLGPSAAELDRVLGRFLQSGITDLILDLRYNGGGLTSIARKLMSQIAGPNTDGELLIRYQYNDKYQSLNTERFFQPETINLGLKRMVVITSGSTASSSEIVINSLRPYIEVVTMGSETSGKPYISRARNFCGKSISAMSAEGVNANGVSVFGGIAADCVARDDLTREFGVVDGNFEGMAESAAEYLVFGRCETPTLSKTEPNPDAALSPSELDEINLPGAVGL